MTQNSKKISKSDIEKREKTFDEYYNEQVIAKKDSLIRADIVYEQLKHKYEDYDATEAFIEYLRSVEKVFAQAEKEMWSVEQTEDELIRGEIFLMAQSTGIDEKIFNDIYDEFKEAKHDVAKVQGVANELIEKYSNIEDCYECEDCRKFIKFVEESLLVFSKTFNGNEKFDELSEVKIEMIKIKMRTLSEEGKPPIEILQEIYKEFVEELKK